MNYPMIKTNKTITYYVDGNTYSFDNKPEIEKVLNEFGLDFIISEKISSISTEIKDHEVAFVKEINGEKYLFPANSHKYFSEKNILEKKPELFEGLSTIDIYNIFNDLNVSSDGKINLKLFCTEEDFENKGILDLRYNSLESNFRLRNHFILFIKAPIPETAGNQLRLNSPNIDIIESLFVDPFAEKDVDDNDF